MNSFYQKYVLAIWFMFFVGNFFSSLLRAWAVVHSGLSGIQTYEQFYTEHAVPILTRLWLGVLVMILWMANPMLFSNALDFWIPSKYLPSGHPLDLNLATVGMFGYFWDSLLDKVGFMIPWLRREIPPQVEKIINGAKRKKE